VTVYWDIKQRINVGTLNKSREINHSVPCRGTDSQWPSDAWCSLPHSLTHPPLYYLQLPQEITLCHMPDRVTHFLTLYWTWNSKLWFGLSRLVYGGPCRHGTVFGLICMSVLCFSTFPTAINHFTLCLYRLWRLPRFISGYYTDVKKKMFNVFMLHAWACVSLSVQQTNWDYVVTVISNVFCSKFPICYSLNSWFSCVTICYCLPVLQCIPCLGWVKVEVSILSTNIKSEFLWHDLSVRQALIANKYPQ
jgi:hypothetical protein